MLMTRKSVLYKRNEKMGIKEKSRENKDETRNYPQISQMLENRRVLMASDRAFCLQDPRGL